MSFSLLSTSDIIPEEVDVSTRARLTPKICPSPSSRLETTPIENQHNEVPSRPVPRSDRRRVGRDRRRRTALRRQSPSPGPAPLLVGASHFTNDHSPPQVEADSTAPATTTMTAAINMDEMTQRLLREEDESVALARMLMAEEAMESYARSADFLQQNAQLYSPEDLEALQAVLQEDGDDSTAESDLSYDTMVRLGERIGDVKSERWAIIARDEINKLEEFSYCPNNNANECVDDSTVKCLVCQFAYEPNEKVRKLPCGHCFHSHCVGSWLMEKDSCPYCRQPLIPNHDY